MGEVKASSVIASPEVSAFRRSHAHDLFLDCWSRSDAQAQVAGKTTLLSPL
jgi:hypothetical protein